ncbi:hypothetical protein E4U41_003324 [Claviceps citrina]|nr:hypothetical protein E4U41_003324 [Claviceps citrina]
MNFFVSLASLALVLAAPPIFDAKSDLTLSGSDVFGCGGLIAGTSVCCATNVLGLVSLDCEIPRKSGCEKGVPSCCTLLIAEQGVLCKKAVVQISHK